MVRDKFSFKDCNKLSSENTPFSTLTLPTYNNLKSLMFFSDIFLNQLSSSSEGSTTNPFFSLIYVFYN